MFCRTNFFKQTNSEQTHTDFKQFGPTVLNQDRNHLTGSCADHRDSEAEFALKFTQTLGALTYTHTHPNILFSITSRSFIYFTLGILRLPVLFRTTGDFD